MTGGRMKLPKNLSTEDLIKSLENAEDTQEELHQDSSNLLSEVLMFISKFNIDKGEYEVNQRYIYRLYRCFSRNPVNSEVFLKKFGLVYPYKSRANFYFINKNILNILKLIEETSKKDRFIRSKFNPKLVNNTKSFLKFLNIQSGEYWVESFILTELYDDYRTQYKKPKYNSKILTKAFGLLLESVKTAHNGFVWFKINKKALDIFDEVRYNEYISTRGLEWWKNLPNEVAITEANERKKGAKDAISIQNEKYRKKYKKKRLQIEKKKSSLP
jgi:hypothetical protein